MEYTKLGNNDIEISRICLGCISFGKFWGRGYMPEAAREIIRHGFEELGMNKIWCGYYEDNQKSKRVQEKIGFIYHHTCEEVPMPLMNEVRIGHTNVMTKEHWSEL